MSEQQIALTLPAPRPRTPIAASADPHTSKLSAAAITASGERDRQAAAVLAAVREHPGHTASELAALIGTLDRFQVGRRLSEIAPPLPGQPDRVVYVNRGPARRCEITKRTCLTWWDVALPAPPPADTEQD